MAAAIGFGVVNGINDAASSVAASIGSRALSPVAAIVLAAFFTFAGAATGLEVARTIGERIFCPDAIIYQTLFSGLLTVMIWGSVATRLGLPVSSSHSLIAGLVGAGAVVMGVGATGRPSAVR